MPRSTLTFYSITNVDGNPTESAVHTDVPGELQLSKERTVHNREKSEVQLIYFFIPDTLLSGLASGMKVTSSSELFKLEYIEDFETHQEVHLIKA